MTTAWIKRSHISYILCSMLLSIVTATPTEPPGLPLTDGLLSSLQLSYLMEENEFIVYSTKKKNLVQWNCLLFLKIKCQISETYVQK